MKNKDTDGYHVVGRDGGMTILGFIPASKVIELTGYTRSEKERKNLAKRREARKKKKGIKL
jgi:hypothetical protein